MLEFLHLFPLDSPRHVNIYQPSSIHHWWPSAVWRLRRRISTSRGKHMAWHETRNYWSGIAGGPGLGLAEYSRIKCYQGTRWAGNKKRLSSTVKYVRCSTIVFIVVYIKYLLIFLLPAVFRSRSRRFISVENCPGGICPVGVCSGVPEHGLLPVCMERRKDSLSGSEGEWGFNLNKLNCLKQLFELKTVCFFSLEALFWKFEIMEMGLFTCDGCCNLFGFF